MAEIFISYSRRDKEFVRKLADALEARKRTVWADWKDIPLTSEWLKEMLKNIEDAECFLFVLSPDSAKSTNCGDEVDHADANHKKVLPILFRPLPDADVPAKIGKYQRVEFVREEDFEAKIEEVIKALDTDLEWTQAHTRLLVRAKEWEREQKDASFLLRGKDLSDAEHWLVKGAERDPKPTTLQSEYVLAGRRNAARRQRLILEAVAVALVVAISLAIYSFLERNKAVKNARESQARALAALSATSLNDDPELGVLLAMQAMGATMRFGEAPVISAEQALHEALFTSQLRRTYAGPGGPVHAARWSPDGRLFATGNDDGSVSLVDVNIGRVVKILPPHSPGPRDPGHGWSVEFSPDGKTIATGNEDGTVSLWDVETGKEKQVLAGHSGRVRAVAFNAGGTRLATGGDDGQAIWWDLRDGRKLRTMQTGGPVHAVAVSAYGVLATAGSGEVVLWNAEAGRRIGPLSTVDEQEVESVAFSQEGDTLAMGLGNGAIDIWDLTEAGVQQRGELRGAFNGVMSLEFSRDGQRLASTGWDGIPRVWDVKAEKLIAEMRFHREGVVRSYSVTFSPDGKTLLTSHQDGSVRLWNAGVGQEYPTLDANPRVLHVAFSADSRELEASGEVYDMGEHALTLRDVASSQQLRKRPCFETDAMGVVFSRDGNKVAESSNSDGVVVCDVKTGKETVMGGNSAAWMGLALSTDGTHVAASDGLGGAIMWDAATGRQSWHEIDPSRHGNADRRAFADDAAFSPDGKLLATGSSEGKIVMWDAATGRRMWEEECHKNSDGVWAVTFSPDGKLLASAGADLLVLVRDVSSREVLLTLHAGTGTVTDVAFSPDGKTLATANGDHRAKVWDVRTGEELLNLRGPTDTVFAVAYSPDGKRLAAGSASGTVEVYALDTHDLLNLARSRVTRDLTAAECSYYLHEKSCPALSDFIDGKAPRSWWLARGFDLMPR